MSKAIAVRDGDKVRTYPLKDFGDFTIADWKRLCLPPIEGDDAFFEEVRRYVGIPKATLMKLPMVEVDKLTTALAQVSKEAQEAKAEAERLADVWKDEGPNSIEFDGVQWRVPKALELDTVFGQWVDMDAALDGATHEPEVMAAICACLLVEEGKEYEGFHKNVERFDAMPVRTAMMLTAFFLQRSERLNNALLRSMQRRTMLLLPAQGQTVIASTNDGDGGQA